ncbi:MAG: ABC transporter ATP-binding protein [Syntrophomonadaceae bacterium]|nr:ABC transporter ATP-binding protein [Syntrophomonadaceae bacterium]
MIDQHQTLWRKYFHDKSKVTIQKGKWVSICSAFNQIVLIIIYFYTAMKIFDKSLTVGDFSLYIGAAGQVINSLFNLIDSGSQMYDNDLKISKFKEFLAWKPAIQESGSLTMPEKPSIEFTNVSFKYPNTERYILKNINFTLPYGEKVALIGLNGAGKSTMIKLLLRLYDPTEGQILINEVDIRKYDVQELRKVFGALFQDYSNYAFSVRENIALSNVSDIHNEERVWKACCASGADSMVKRFGRGLDTYLTKIFNYDGEELSGGEWQKIALARTFFRDADIVILDEPSSALDPYAEDVLFKQIVDLYAGKTVVFVSHHLSTITMADKILLIENGEIVENGSHQDLMKSAGKYAFLFNLQAQRYKVEKRDEAEAV